MSTAVRSLPTAGQRLTAVLADQGVTVHTDDDAGNSWLLIALDQTSADFPGARTPHLVAYVYEAHEDWLFVDEPMEHWAGTWRVLFNDGRSEETVFTGQNTADKATETAECAAFITDYLSKPRPTAGAVLLAALAEYGIIPRRTSDVHSTTYDVFLPLPRTGQLKLSIADRDGSADHQAAEHTGWSILLHDEHGAMVGDPVYITGEGGPVDCAEDSAAAAAVVAEWLTSPVSRHCDCYAQDGWARRHDHECNRYRKP